MSISFREAEEILRLIDEFPVAEIRFEHRDLKLYMRRVSGQPTTGSAAATPAQITGAEQASSKREASGSVETLKPAKPVRTTADNQMREGQTAVSAPVAGTFYSAPSPGAEPFVVPGQIVKQGDDLFIIEVMKLMNLVKAPIGGKVMGIAVDNGEAVQQSQPVLWIKT